MKVKISYTADMEDVLLEVAHVFENMSKRTEAIDDSFQKILKNLRGGGFNFNEAVDDVHQVRVNYAKLDLRLAETLDMMVGYDNYQRELRGGTPIGGQPEDSEGEEDND